MIIVEGGKVDWIGVESSEGKKEGKSEVALKWCCREAEMIFILSNKRRLCLFLELSMFCRCVVRIVSLKLAGGVLNPLFCRVFLNMLLGVRVPLRLRIRVPLRLPRLLLL